MNSIVNNITKNDKIAEIQLLLNSDIDRKKTVIVVEGLDDIKFMSSVCNNIDNNLIIQSYSGKIGVKEIMDVYKNEKRVIGILDRDYSQEEINEKIFYYDNSCLEMMLIESNNTFFNIYMEYIYPYEKNFEDFRMLCLNELKYISLLRKINEEEKLGIDFGRMSISNVFNNGKINIVGLKKQINERNNNYLINNVEIEKKIDKEYKCDILYKDLLAITNGHDFCDMVAIFSRNSKRKGISKEIIQMVLRCSYRDDDFKRTKLYENLKKYEIRYQLDILGE